MTVIVWITFPLAMNESPHFPISSLAFGIVSVLNFGHSSGYAVIYHCCFSLHFPDKTGCRASFHILIFHLYIFFDEDLMRPFPFF